MSRSMPGRLDRYQLAVAMRNALAAQYKDPKTGLLVTPPPFISTPIHLRWESQGRVFDRVAVRRERSKYPLPVAPSKQNGANARRAVVPMAQWEDVA